MNGDQEPLLTPRERAFLENSPEAEINVQQKTQSQADNVSDLRGDLVGVKGWLAFLAISLSILGPLMTLSRTAIDMSSAEALNPALADDPRWGLIVVIAWGAAFLSAAIGVFAGYRLYARHNPATVKIVITCIWVLGPGISVAAFILINAITHTEFLTSEFIATLVQPLVYSTIWTLYLLNSKRVKNTYLREGRNEIAGVFE